MSLTLESITQIIHPKDEFVVVVGAGISKSPPSNLPTGIDFMNSFYNFLTSGEEDPRFESDVEVLKNHKSLRFENIMSLIQNNSIVGIRPLLDCYKECDVFNESHDLLSILGKLGHVIVTTNFDSLLERAYLANGIPPKPIIYDEEYKISHLIGNIYKIHGSVERYNYKANAWLDSLDSIKLTLEQVAIQGYKFATSIHKRQFLSENFRNRSLLFVGYSGYDDFDIIPILLDTRSEQKIIWLNYNPGDSSVYLGEDILNIPEKFGKSGQIISELIVKRQRGKDRCYIVQADALPFLFSIMRALTYDYSKPSKQEPNYSVDPDAYFIKRLGRILPNRELIEIIKATLLAKAEHYDTALEIYQTLLGSIKRSDSYLRSKILYEIAVCYCNLTPPQYKTALPYVKESFDIDASNNFKWVFLSAELFARICREIGETDLTQKLYETIVTISTSGSSDYFIKYQQATALNNYSLLLFKTGQISEAIQCAEKSISLFKGIGDFDGIVKSTISISGILMESGLIDKAIEKLWEIERIASDLDSPQDLCALYNELGVAFRYKGDFKTAIDYHNKGAGFAQITGSQLELSRQYYNIALCEFEQDNLKVALDFNNKSFEIRDRAQEGETKWSSMSENFQLYGNLFVKMAKFELAKKSLEKSVEYAEKANYARVICDSYCNLLTLSMLLGKDTEVEMHYTKLRYLLTEKYEMFDRWERVEVQTSLYWLLKGALFG